CVDDARDRFSLYQDLQRTPQQMANMLTYGTAKYNRSKRDQKKKKAKRRIKQRRRKDKTVGKPERTKTKKWRAASFDENKKKVPLVVFRAEMFGKDLAKMKGLRCGAVGKLYQILKRRESEGQLIVVTIDEFNISKTCSLCLSLSLKTVSTSNFKGNGVVSCQSCHKLWQRYVNAARN
ncbi:uncharacterized protein BX663DRAFT_415342, partial [Cokeromyces recurvatus]|uniref:uncharacterized protein n=1 Tax=Cokeromyces recurvatus TaxID=90255 RepID=UPI00221E505E